MRFLSKSICSANGPKWLGTYEIELNDVWREFRGRNFDRIIDVGAAEGYYAVGCALTWPRAKTIAFETEETGRILIAELAAMNQVQDRLEIRGFCDPAALCELVSGASSPLIIMDVEGCEASLLSPQTAPSLAQAHIVVEIHDFIDREIGRRIWACFSASHTIEEIHTRQRVASDFVWPKSEMYKRYLLKALQAHADEWRPEAMRWFVMRPVKEKLV